MFFQCHLMCRMQIALYENSDIMCKTTLVLGAWACLPFPLSAWLLYSSAARSILHLTGKYSNFSRIPWFYSQTLEMQNGGLKFCASSHLDISSFDYIYGAVAHCHKISLNSIWASPSQVVDKGSATKTVPDGWKWVTASSLTTQSTEPVLLDHF